MVRLPFLLMLRVHFILVSSDQARRCLEVKCYTGPNLLTCSSDLMNNFKGQPPLYGKLRRSQLLLSFFFHSLYWSKSRKTLEMAQSLVKNRNERRKLKSTNEKLSIVCCKKSKTDHRIKFLNLKKLELSHSSY